jgi:AraC-like DNA-binding protein
MDRDRRPIHATCKALDAVNRDGQGSRQNAMTMNDSVKDTALQVAVRTHQVPVAGELRSHVSALLGIEATIAGRLPLSVAPHDAIVLAVQFVRDRQDVDLQSGLGSNTRVTGIREWTGRFSDSTGSCLALFALLTPLGAVQLLNSRRLDASPRIRVPLAHLLDLGLTRQLESRIVVAGGLPAKLAAFGAWLEERVHQRGLQNRDGLRAARAAMRLCADPTVAMDRLADEQHVSRRQVERDFSRWLGVSPRHLSQVARVQGVARRAHAGASLADAAAEMGFADQSHMNRVVRQLTGVTPREFVRPPASPIAAAFHAATGGGKVYL